jgi:SAM-dependent methyltransferase
MECLVCEAHGYKRSFPAKEQLMGTHEAFEYVQCEACESLQITEIPVDMGRYYPPDYYSMVTDEAIPSLGRLKRFIRAARTNYYVDGKNPIGWVISKVAPKYYDLPWEWFRGHVSARSRILDIGCGMGELLRRMRWRGFRHLTGIDPFIPHSIETEGLQILSGELRDLDESFDFVMLHHSLEHVPNPLGVLSEARRLVRPGGAVLLRVPVAGTWAEQHYGVNWIGLDPPRHLFVPSRRGLSELARRAGLLVTRYWSDTSEGTLLASEAFARGFSPYDRETKTWLMDTRFTQSEIKDARERAAELNRAEDGDTGCFLLRALR